MTDGRGRSNGREPDDDGTIDEPETADDIAAGEEQANAPVSGSLTTLIEELAAADPDVQRRLAAQGTEFVIGGTVFAGLQGDGASFRLRPEIATAARGTPGVRPSTLGAGWVAFHPTRWDRFALDRAVAWWNFARKFAGTRA